MRTNYMMTVDDVMEELDVKPTWADRLWAAQWSMCFTEMQIQADDWRKHSHFGYRIRHAI